MSTRFIEKAAASTDIIDLPNAGGIGIHSNALKFHNGSSVVTVATLDGAEALTNKTLTAPTITGGSLTSSSLVTPLGVMVALEALFTQTSGNGTYTAPFAIPAGATIYDIIVTNTVVWNASTSATMKIGINGGDDDCFFTALDVKTVPAAGKSIRFAWPGGAQGASVPAIDVGGEGGAAASSATQLGATSGFLYSATAQQIDAIITQVGTGTAGRTRVTVLYSLPAAVASATKA